jgi:hypothetical protein
MRSVVALDVGQVVNLRPIVNRPAAPNPHFTHSSGNAGGLAAGEFSRGGVETV